MTKKQIMEAVLTQVENMFCNDLRHEYGASNFETWCEEQFDTEEDPDACYKLANEISGIVNELEWKLAEYAEI